mgnify:CR=1 FL=1|jgi:predicted nucleotidyltransferase
MLQKSSNWQTLGVFFESPTKEHYLMDISRQIGIAHTSVKNNLKSLVKQGLIQENVEKKGTRKFPIFKANLDSRKFKRSKQIYNLTMFLESGIIEFIEEKLTPNTIVLFGSYQRGEDIEDSDIDVFVEYKQKDLNISKFEKKLRRKVQLHFKEKFTSYPNELKNNIINGVVVQGFLEGYK